MNIESIAEALRGRKNSNGYICHCPSHEDNNPSLSICETDNKILFNCHAGCEQQVVIAALRTKGLWPSTINKLSTPGFSTKWYGKAYVAHWTYRDSNNDTIGYAVRYEKNGDKDVIPFFKKDGTKWKTGAFKKQRPLYALNLLSKNYGDDVYVYEGEKCAQCAIDKGLLATTSLSGCKAAAKTDWKPLAGRNIIFWRDNDKPGEKYQSDVIKILNLLTPKPNVKIIDVDKLALPESGDIVDWLVENPKANKSDIEKLPILSVDDPEIPSGTSAETICFADVKAEPIQWLWPNRIAKGKITLISGDPGLGKSILTVGLAAHITTGTPWPVDKSQCVSGSVLMISGEDDPGDTIRPRLDAAGANVSKVHLLTFVLSYDQQTGEKNKRSFSLDDIDALEEALKIIPDCRLVTIDPISAYLSGSDSHKNSDIRGLLLPLQECAQRHKVAIICVTHLNKSSGSAIYRSMGSLAFIAAARAAYVVAKDKEDSSRRLFLPQKNNLGDDLTGFAYRVQTAENGAPQLVWDQNPVNVTAEEALTPALLDNEHESKLELAVEWLRELLADGPMSAEKVKEAVKSAGQSLATVRRAKDVLKIKPSKTRFDGHWEWGLPTQNEINQGAQAQCEGAPSQNDEHLRDKRASSTESTTYKAVIDDNLSNIHEDAQGAQPRSNGVLGNELNNLGDDREQLTL